MGKEILFGIYKIENMRQVVILLMLLITTSSFGQINNSTKKDSSSTKQRKTKIDSIMQNSDRFLAMNRVKEVYEGGAIIIRLLLNKKSAELYRKAGKEKVADRIEEKLNKKNKALAIAFLDEYFRFCPVYVIEAQDYGRALNGEKKGYFLDKSLKVDSTIELKEKNFIFLEFGDIYEVVKKQNSFYESEVTSTPIGYDVLVFKDKNLQQIFSPYPYYIKKNGVTVDSKAWDDWIKGTAFISELPVNDSVSIADTVIYMRDINPADSLKLDSVKFGEYYEYILRLKKNNEYIQLYKDLLLSKVEFGEYLNKKYKLDKSQEALIMRVWEYQTRIYGFYSKAKSYKNKGWFKYIFSYPFGIPDYDYEKKYPNNFPPYWQHPNFPLNYPNITPPSFPKSY